MPWRCWFLLLLLCGPGGAWSACERPLRVPAAPVGLSVVIEGREVRGIYPDLLRRLEQRQTCRFVFDVVPRARLERMFETGEADLLIPATRSPAREVHGEFVPLLRSRAALLTLADRPSLNSLAELLRRRDLRVVVVRGFAFGEAYQQMLERLRREGRLVAEADTGGVARALELGMADVAVMTPSILLGSLTQDERGRALAARLRVDNVEEFAWGESGLYLSRKALNDRERLHLRALFAQPELRREVWQAFVAAYPPGSLGSSVQPL